MFTGQGALLGQKQSVKVDVITTEGEKSVMQNLQRKAKAADKMFSDLVSYMNDSLAIDRSVNFTKKEKVPAWL